MMAHTLLVGASYDAAYFVDTPYLIVGAGDEVFDYTAAVHDTEDANPLFRTLVLEMVDGVVLSVEDAFEMACVVADGGPRHTGHVDVGGEYAIGVVFAIVDYCRELDELVGIGYLVSTIHLVECERLRAGEPSHGHHQH